MHNTTRVRLPEWVFTQAGDDKNKLRELVLDYMKRYPSYTILRVKNGFAVCRIER